jgi:hypothetical protein
MEGNQDRTKVWCQQEVRIWEPLCLLHFQQASQVFILTTDGTAIAVRKGVASGERITLSARNDC